jgi:PAS domain S-box-containing protein
MDNVAEMAHATSSPATMKAHGARPSTMAEQVAGALDASRNLAVIGLNAQGHVLHWNAGAARIFGYAASEIVGHSIADLLPPPSANARHLLSSRLHKASEQGEAVVESWHLAKGDRRIWASGAITPLPGSDAGFLCLLRDNTDFMAERSRHTQVLSSMPYRLHNLFATLQAVASQSLMYSGAEGFRTAFGSRVSALGRAFDALGDEGWETSSLNNLIQQVVAPYSRGRRLSTGGPALRLGADVVTTFALMLRELADNALAHGAWSLPGGCVSVYWSVTPPVNGHRTAEIVWREFNGPPVTWPSHRGFGMLMLHRCPLPGGGTTHLHFHATGLECRMRLPTMAGLVDILPGMADALPFAPAIPEG